MLLGHVYCSRQQKVMGGLETGTLFIKSKTLEETSDHVSRLSIRCTLNGEQHYKVGGNDHLVTPKNYLVVNQGQHYRTSFQNKEEQEMILVAFKPRFAEDLLYSMITPEDKLLDDPFHTVSQPVSFFEKTYDQDPVISELFLKLRKLIDVDEELKKEADLDEIYTALLSRLIQVHRNLNTDIDKLKSVKRSTRAELFRRLSIARDHIEANIHSALKLEDISAVAGLSVHHFKREFKDLFGISPHRFVILKRMEKALLLLKDPSLQIEDVRMASGFENTSSFIRLFRHHNGITPGAYRELK